MRFGTRAGHPEFRESSDSSADRTLIELIESYAGREIRVKEKPGIKAARCIIGPRHATSHLKSLGSIEVEDMLHELLHIRRYWNLRVPQLMAKNRGNQAQVDEIGSIDNILEHLVIVPEQADFGFDPARRWNLRERREWSSRFWERSRDPRDRRINLLLSYLTFTRLVTDPSVKVLADRTLESFGLLQEARDFAADVCASLGDKARVAATVKRVLPLRDSDAELVVFDVLSGTEDPTPIA